MTLWRLAALDPALITAQRDGLCVQLKNWHIQCVDKLRKARSAPNGAISNGTAAGGNAGSGKKSEVDLFPGFKSAIEACQLNWNDYVLPGVVDLQKFHQAWKYSLPKNQEVCSVL